MESSESGTTSRTSFSWVRGCGSRSAGAEPVSARSGRFFARRFTNEMVPGAQGCRHCEEARRNQSGPAGGPRVEVSLCDKTLTPSTNSLGIAALVRRSEDPRRTQLGPSRGGITGWRGELLMPMSRECSAGDSPRSRVVLCLTRSAGKGSHRSV